MKQRVLIAILAATTMGMALLAPTASGQEAESLTTTTAAPSITPESPAPAEEPVAGAVPPAPSGLVAESLDGGATVGWDAVDVDPEVTTYVVRRDGEVVAEVDGDETEVTEDALLAEETYEYTVAAVNEIGEGPESDVVAVIPTSDTTPGFSNREAAQTERRVYTYSIATRGRISANVGHFATHVAHTLSDPRGWALGGSIEFRQVSSGGNFTIWMAEAGTVPSFSSACSSSWSCRSGRNVIINQSRWLGATPSWRGAGGSLDSYQHYVVIHETGHWLGFGHANCPGGGQLAPTMQQQSKGLQGCRHNGWPTGGERASLSRRTGAPALPVGRANAVANWGRAGDVVLSCDWNGDGRDTPGIFRNGTWYVRNGLTTGRARSFRYGRAGDTPVCGNWNGRGGDGVGVVRGREWFLRNSASGGPTRYRFLFGSARSQPIVGDWDGRVGDTPGRVYGGVWVLRNSPSAGPVQWRLRYGRHGDQFLPGDWDGDGTDEPGVVRGTRWYMQSNWYASGGVVVRYGRGTPIAGRWDGLAVDKPGRFGRGRWVHGLFSPRP